MKINENDIRMMNRMMAAEMLLKEHSGTGHSLQPDP